MSELENEIQAKFAHLSDERLISRMNRAPDFGYDDEEVELTRRLKLGGLAWRWATVDGRERVEVYKPEPTDEELIDQAIAQAQATESEISDAAARMIASQLHSGQASALYALASSGFIDEDRLARELVINYEEFTKSPQVHEWINTLVSYAVNREDKGPQEDWDKLWLGREAEDGDE